MKIKMEEDLRDVMRIIDENCTRLPEGDYLEICNRLQKMFKNNEDREMTPLNDYANFDIFTNDQTDRALDYFYNHYYTELIENDISFLVYQKRYLEEERDQYKPLRRICKSVKTNAIRHYCWLHNFVLDEYTEECLKKYHDDHGFDIGEDGAPFEVAVKRLYRSYITIENIYRSFYCESINIRIQKINNWIDNFRDM